jgi:NADH:ubiquinone oxidoreductase subunit 6 (subunit J)
MDWGQYAYAIAFYAAAALAVASAAMVVWHKNPVVNALYLVLTLFALAVVFVLLHAHFLAAVQVLVYAGAALVLFLLIIMLLNLDEQSLKIVKPGLAKAVGVAAVFAVTLMIAAVAGGLDVKHDNESDPGKVEDFVTYVNRVRSGYRETTGTSSLQALAMSQLLLKALDDPQMKAHFTPPDKIAALPESRFNDLRDALVTSLGKLNALEQISPPGDFKDFSRQDMLDLLAAVGQARLEQMREFGTTAGVGRLLFSLYILPFEIASFLLLGAIIGVLVLARRKPAEEGG